MSLAIKMVGNNHPTGSKMVFVIDKTDRRHHLLISGREDVWADKVIRNVVVLEAR